LVHGRCKPNGRAKAAPAFNAQAFLDSAGLSTKIVEYGRGETIFTQGDPCEDVLYIQRGGVKLSVLSKTGREAVVAMIGPGDFFGEGCLAGQPIRWGAQRPSPQRDPIRREGKDSSPLAQAACDV
jgi:CRP/FNR family cyclic AMP-dependent transcriptional regulator